MEKDTLRDVGDPVLELMWIAENGVIVSSNSSSCRHVETVIQKEDGTIIDCYEILVLAWFSKVHLNGAIIEESSIF